MIRICVYGCNDTVGGTEKYILMLYEGIDKSKIQFDFLFDHTAGEIPYANQIERNGGRIYREYYKHRDRKVSGAVAINDLFDRHPEWDGVYVNSQSIDTAYRLIISAKKHGLKYRIIHAHNYGYTYNRSFKDQLFEVYFHLTKSFYVTHYLACSEAAGKWLFKNNLFKVIPNAVDFQTFAFDPKRRKEIRDEYGLADKLVVGFCGRIVPQKNPIFLMDIFSHIHRKLPNAHLLVLGDGIMMPELKDCIDQYKLNDAVTLLGAVDHVNDYMPAMDCLVLPSEFEGFGIVLLEAQAAGLNCFASKDVIPCETNVSGHVKFIALSSGAEAWAEEIIKTGFERYDAMDQLMNSAFTIANSVKLFMSIFSE